MAKKKKRQVASKSRVKRKKKTAKVSENGGYKLKDIIFAVVAIFVFSVILVGAMVYYNSGSGLYHKAKDREKINKLTLEDAYYLYKKGDALFVDCRGVSIQTGTY